MCATSGQKDAGQELNSIEKQLHEQGSLIFGASSHVFNDLMSTFAPTVAAGPSQMGFSAPELANLNSQAITNMGQASRNASQSVKEANAAVGGGNMALPSGADIGRNLSVANSAAAETSRQLGQINEANWQTGRENYDTAVKGMEAAPGVFDPSTSASNATTNSANAAAGQQNEIAKSANSWQNAVSGVLGDVSSVATAGLMKHV